MTCRALFVSVLVLTLPTSARAQSLAEAAARERDRRARQSPGAPSYDDYDLNKGKPSPSPSPSPSPRPLAPARTATPVPGLIRGGRVPSPRPSPRPTPSAVPSGAAPSAAVPSPTPTAPVPGPEASEAYWRARARDLRDALGNAERQVAELEARVNALRNDLAPTNAMQANREQNRRAALGQAVADLEQAQAAVARARQALEDLEDEARRKGALPGWLRER